MSIPHLKLHVHVFANSQLIRINNEMQLKRLADTMKLRHIFESRNFNLLKIRCQESNPNSVTFIVDQIFDVNTGNCNYYEEVCPPCGGNPDCEEPHGYCPEEINKLMKHVWNQV